MRINHLRPVVCLLALAIPPISSGSTIFSGNLTGPDDVAQFGFTLSSVSDISIQTYQYGGNDSLGVPPGGIDSVLSLYLGNDASATLQGFNDDGNCPPANQGANGCLDSTLFFSAQAPGPYIFTVSASTNYPNGPTLGSGFTGGGAITSTNYFVTLDVNPLTSVPEPATSLAAGCGLLALAALRRSRRRSPQAAFLVAIVFAGCSFGADIVVGAGGDFQAALNAAQPGDTITLQAGSVYTGNFVAPVKTGDAFIAIRSSAAALLPKPGVRVSPADAVNMPALVTPYADPVLDFALGAHHYRLTGIEMRPTSGLYVFELIRIGSFATQLSQLPHDIIIDQCYLHGDPEVGSKRGISLNGGATAITNSYLTDFKDTAQETQAIGGWSGSGPYQIINNFLEAAGVTILFGGGPPQIPGVIPSDIQVRQNYFFKPLSWNPNDPSYAGIPYLVKQHFEMKFGQRVVVDGNVMENSWYPPLAGRAIVLGPRADVNYTNPMIQDVQITRNIMRNAGAGILIFGRDELAGLVGSLDGVTVQNNLFLDMLESNSLAGFGTAGVLATVHTGAANVAILHNTYIGQGQNVFWHLNTLGPNYRVENNLLQHNLHGISWQDMLYDLAALNAVAPLGYSFQGNVIQGGAPANFPAGNFFPASNQDIGYANLPLRDVRLTPSSPYRNAATDGKDIGADTATVYQVTQGVVPGTGQRCITSLAPSPSTLTFDRTGGSGTVAVAAPAACFWMTTISPGWLTVTGGFSAMGPGIVSYSVPAYVGGTATRSTSLLIGGSKLIVRQTP